MTRPLDRTPLGRPSRTQLLAVLTASTVVQFGAIGIGWWWISVLAAFAVTAVLAGRAAVLVAAGSSVLAWGASLLWQSGGRVLDVADLVGAMALQARGLGTVVLAATMVYALLLALAGSWLGAAARRVMSDRRAHRAPATESTVDSNVLDDSGDDEPELPASAAIPVASGVGPEAKTEEEQHV